MKTGGLWIYASILALALTGAAVPLALAQDASNTAPAVAAVQTAPGTIEIIPAIGPVGEEVRIVGSGLPPNSPVIVLGGVDPARLAPLVGDEDEEQQQTPLEPEFVDTSGAFRTIVGVPDTADYGSAYYFALRIGDQVTQPMAYQVDAREPQN